MASLLTTNKYLLKNKAAVARWLRESAIESATFEGARGLRETYPKRGKPARRARAKKSVKRS